jgi:uncharacterized membrane protein
MDELMSGLTLAAALGAELVAGIFFSFSAFIMAALKRLPPEGGISAMQSINVAVLNPVFFFVFFGTAAAALILAIAAFAGCRRHGRLICLRAPCSISPEPSS